MSGHSQNRQCESKFSFFKRKLARNSHFGSNVENDDDEEDEEDMIEERPRKKAWSRFFRRIQNNFLGCIYSDEDANYPCFTQGTQYEQPLRKIKTASTSCSDIPGIPSEEREDISKALIKPKLLHLHTLEPRNQQILYEELKLTVEKMKLLMSKLSTMTDKAQEFFTNNNNACVFQIANDSDVQTNCQPAKITTAEEKSNDDGNSEENPPQACQMPCIRNCQVENDGRFKSVNNIEVIMSSSLENELEAVLNNGMLNENQRNDLEMLFRRFFNDRTSNDINSDNKPSPVREKSIDVIEFLLSKASKEGNCSSDVSSKSLIPSNDISTDHMLTDSDIISSIENDNSDCGSFYETNKSRNDSSLYEFLGRSHENVASSFMDFEDNERTMKLRGFEGLETGIRPKYMENTHLKEYMKDKSLQPANSGPTKKCSMCGLEEMLDDMYPKNKCLPKISIEEAIRIPAKMKANSSRDKTINLDSLIEHSKSKNVTHFEQLKVYTNKIGYYRTPGSLEEKMHLQLNEDNNQISDSGIETTRTSGLTTHGLYGAALSKHRSMMVARLRGDISTQNTQSDIRKSQEISYNISDKDDCLKCLGEIVYKLYSSAMSTAEVNVNEIDSCFTPKEVEISLTIPFKDAEGKNIQSSLQLPSINKSNSSNSRAAFRNKVSKATSVMVQRVPPKDLVNHDTQVYGKKFKNLKSIILASVPNLFDHGPFVQKKAKVEAYTESFIRSSCTIACSENNLHQTGAHYLKSSEIDDDKDECRMNEAIQTRYIPRKDECVSKSSGIGTVTQAESIQTRHISRRDRSVYKPFSQSLEVNTVQTKDFQVRNKSPRAKSSFKPYMLPLEIGSANKNEIKLSGSTHSRKMSHKSVSFTQSSDIGTVTKAISKTTGSIQARNVSPRGETLSRSYMLPSEISDTKFEVRECEETQTSRLPSKTDAFTLTLDSVNEITDEEKHLNKPKERKLKLLRHYACQSPDFNFGCQYEQPREFILNSVHDDTSLHVYYSLQSRKFKPETSYLVPEKDICCSNEF